MRVQCLSKFIFRHTLDVGARTFDFARHRLYVSNQAFFQGAIMIRTSALLATVFSLTAAPAAVEAQMATEVRSGDVYVAGAKVVTVDVAASNGVIHIIDSVMLPPET